MIHGLLPLFLVTVLGASAMSVGIIEGIAEGCRQAGCALIGGETADRTVARLEQALKGNSIRASLEDLAPTHQQYKGLQAALATERDPARAAAPLAEARRRVDQLERFLGNARLTPEQPHLAHGIHPAAHPAPHPAQLLPGAQERLVGHRIDLRTARAREPQPDPADQTSPLRTSRRNT